MSITGYQLKTVVFLLKTAIVMLFSSNAIAQTQRVIIDEDTFYLNDELDEQHRFTRNEDNIEIDLEGMFSNSFSNPNFPPNSGGPIFDIEDSSIFESWDSEEINPYKNSVDNIQLNTIIVLPQNFTVPCNCEINSPYGYRRWGRRYRFHTGLDLDLPYGEPAKVAFDGIVRYSKYHPGYGYTVIVRHLNGLETLYGHFSELKVESGQQLSAGDTVGLGGSTGHSTGPHLHFEVRYQGVPFDPQKLFSFSTNELKTDTIEVNNNLFSYGKPPKTNASYHVVKKGETLYSIANRNHTSVSTICKLNRINAKTKLKPGQRLRVR